MQQVVEVRGDPEINEIRPGWFEGRQTIVQRIQGGVRERILRARAKSQSVLQRFFQLFRENVGTPSTTPPTSVAEVVNRARATLRQELNLTDAEFNAVLLDQTGRTYVVEIEQTETVIALRPV